MFLLRNDAFQIEFRHGNGDGTFAPSKVFSAPFGLGINPTVPFAAADFNGDGKLELISFAIDINGLQMIILLGNGDGSFATPRTTLVSSLGFGVSDYVAVLPGCAGPRSMAIRAIRSTW